jgi:hypothetical protein
LCGRQFGLPAAARSRGRSNTAEVLEMTTAAYSSIKDDRMTKDDTSVEEASRALRAWAESLLKALNAAEEQKPASLKELADAMHEQGYWRDPFPSDKHFKKFLKRLHLNDLTPAGKKKKSSSKKQK